MKKAAFFTFFAIYLAAVTLGFWALTGEWPL